MKPFRIKVEGTCAVSLDIWKQNAAANAHHPRIQKVAPHARRLAIVGGGPLVIHDLDELRAWDGDIWAINDTATWLTGQGVTCTLFTVDAQQITGDAANALLATVCDPELFARYAGRLQCFDMVETHENGFAGGCFSSTRAPGIALQMGYIDVSFFGCEGSFEGADHVDRDEARPHQLIVRAGNNDYRTTPPFLIQCQELVNILFFDNVYHNRSGGLLRAMQEHPETWEVVGVSAALKEHLERDGPTGLYDEPYVPIEVIHAVNAACP